MTATAEDRAAPGEVRERGPRLSTVFTIVFAAGGFALGIRRLHDNSFMWHLRTGEFILDHGIPRRDPYSFSAPGVKWVAQSWLAELAYGVVDRLGGAFGLRLLGGAVGLVVGFALYRIALAGVNDRVRAGALTLAAMAVLLNVWSERPLMFGLLGMLGVVAVVEMPGSWIGRRPLVALPVLMWLWANVHGTFSIGFGYLALHLLGRALEGCPPSRGREKDLLRGSVLAGVVTFANPYGIDLVLFPVRLIGRGEVLSDVSEWQSPDFRDLGGMFFVLFAIGTLVVLARTRPGWRDLAVTVAFVLLGFWAIRNVGLAVIAILPVLARALRNDAPRMDVRRAIHRPMVVLAVLVLVLTVVQAAGEEDWDLDKYPVGAYRLLEAQGFEGRRLFTTDAWGGYVIARAWPAQKVFFDDRYDMYPLAINRDYGTIARVAPEWSETLDRHHIEVVLWPRKSALVQALAERADWRRVHDDEVATLFVRAPVPAR
jgi:hypothetical protein